MPQVSLEALHDLARRALLGAGADVDLAQATAAALVYADARGQAAHGVARIPQYAAHLRNGRADGRARPRVLAAKGGATLIDAGSGLAYRRLRHGNRRGHRSCCATSVLRSPPSPTATTSAWPDTTSRRWAQRA